MYVWIYRVVLFNAMQYMMREKRMLFRYILKTGRKETIRERKGW